MSFYILGRKYITHQPPRPPPDPFLCSQNGPEPYRCYYCHFSTNLLVEHNRHAALLHPPRAPLVYTCDQCTFETCSRLVLLKHARTACAWGLPNPVLVLATGGLNRVKFLLCDRAALKVRPPAVVPCSGAKPRCYRRKYTLVCEHCPFRSVYKKTMVEHMVRRHTPDEEVVWFRCEECPYKAKFSHHLDRHRLKVHTASRIECPECPYRSAWRPDFVKHYRKRHASDAKVYVCDKCPLRTKYSTHFRRHQREQHSDHFQWLQCDHCPYKAKQKVHMKLHVVQRHTPPEDIEWYECQRCEYRAKIKASLKNHVLKKHTASEDTDWFVCEKCGYKTRERSFLRKHLEKKHGGSGS